MAPRLLRLGPAARVLIPAAALVVDLVLWHGDSQTRLGWALPAWAMLVPAACAYATLAIRRRPGVAYATLWAFSLMGVLVPRFDSFLGFSVALFAMARHGPTAPARWALVGSAVPIVINTVNGASYNGAFDPMAGLMMGLLWTLLFLGVWWAGRSLACGDQLRAEALRQERLRIGQELHDIVAHSLTAIVLQSSGLTAGRRAGTVAEHQVDQALEAIEHTASVGVREMHRLLGLIRNPAATTTAEDSAAADIEDLLAVARSAGLSVRLGRSGVPAALDSSVEHAAYRVVQEGLSNAMKYAPAGAEVLLSWEWTGAGLHLTVSNPVRRRIALDGRSGGFGLVGLRERLNVIGGAIETRNREGRFELHALLPTMSPAPTVVP